MCVTQIQNEKKQLKLNPKKAPTIQSRIKEKEAEVKVLITDVKYTLDEVGQQLKDRQTTLQMEIQQSK